MNQQRAFCLDVRSCVGCKACQIACKDKNRLGPALLFRRVLQLQGGKVLRLDKSAVVEETLGYFLSLSCMHCARPICVEVCPTKAMTRRQDGIVYVRSERCIGCAYCQIACPFGAPRLNPDTGTMGKCDLCRDELDRGRQPACVAACQLRVITVGYLKDLRCRHGEVNRIFPLPAASLTEPSAVLKPHRDCSRADENTADIGNREEQ